MQLYRKSKTVHHLSNISTMKSCPKVALQAIAIVFLSVAVFFVIVVGESLPSPSSERTTEEITDDSANEVDSGVQAEVANDTTTPEERRTSKPL